MKALKRLSLNKRRSAGKRKRNPRRLRNGNGPTRSGMGMLSQPLNTAFVVQNNVRSHNIVREQGKEIIGSVNFQQAVSNGIFPVVEFDLSPVALEGTRLASLSRSFQKFRFRNGTKFTIQSQAPSFTVGGYVAGFTENPDQNMGTGARATTAISALAGATSSPVWVAQTVPIHIRDTKWYNIDADTLEIMDAIQGKLVIQQTSAVSTTENITAPIWLEWDVEFTGHAIQIDDSVNQVTAILPYGDISATGSTDNSAYHRNEVGCLISQGDGAVATAEFNSLYQIFPGIETNTGESINYCWVYNSVGTNKYYVFAGDEDQALNGDYFNWTTLFGDSTFLPTAGSVLYFIRNIPSGPPLPGRSAPPDNEVLTVNIGRSNRLNLAASAREDADTRMNKMSQAKLARHSILERNGFQ